MAAHANASAASSAAAAATASAGSSSAAPPPAAGSALPLSHLLRSMTHDVLGLFSDRVHLVSLELRRAGLVLAQVVALVMAAVVLSIAAWLALWTAVGLALVEAGWHWSWALLLVIALNLVAAVLALLRARRLSGLLTLPATLRHLTLRGTAPPEPPSMPLSSTPRPAPASSRGASADRVSSPLHMPPGEGSTHVQAQP